MTALETVEVAVAVLVAVLIVSPAMVAISSFLVHSDLLVKRYLIVAFEAPRCPDRQEPRSVSPQERLGTVLWTSGGESVKLRAQTGSYGTWTNLCWRMHHLILAWVHLVIVLDHHRCAFCYAFQR